MEWVYVAIAAVFATVISLVKAKGKREGVMQERQETAEVVEELEIKEAENELEAKRALPWTDRATGFADRIRRRRAKG